VCSNAVAPDRLAMVLPDGHVEITSVPLSPSDLLQRLAGLLYAQLHDALDQRLRDVVSRQQLSARALDEAQAEVLERLALAAEERDGITGRHTRRVGELAALLAARVGLGADEVERIRRAAPLHDVGKIGVPDHILSKPGPLTAEERERMRTHTSIGARLLSHGRTALMATAAEIAESHHEHWDGTGYPRGLQGAEIPLSARIVAVADVYDALSSDRPYRKALSPDEVLRVIADESGRSLDPAMVREFLGILAQLPRLHR
jgi:putative two-component system response regulator